MQAAFHAFRQRPLQRDTLLMLSAETLYRLSGFVLLMVLSRYLPAEEIGVYFFALSFAQIFLVFASFGLTPILMRRVAAEPHRATLHLSTLLGFRLVSSPLYLVCVSAAAFVFVREIWQLVVAVAVFALLENISLVFGSFFIALQKVVYNVSIGIVVEVFFLAGFLLGMLWAPSLEVLVQANLLRALCLVGAALFLTQRWLCPLQVSWDGRFVKESSPFVFFSLLALLRGRLDTLLLGFLTDYSAVGHYQLAFRVMFASFFVPVVVGLMFFPQLSTQGLDAENRRLLVRGGGFLVGSGLLGIGVIFLAGDPLAELLYGPLASVVTPLLRPLTFALPLSFLNLFLSSALQALHHERRALGILSIGTGAGLSANFILIPLWGAYGAVYAYIFSALVQLGLLAWYFRHLFAQPLSAQPLSAQPQRLAAEQDE